MIDFISWIKLKFIKIEKYDNGAAAYWKEAEEQALNCGVNTIIRRQYAWVIGSALEVAKNNGTTIKKLEEDSVQSVKELFINLHERYPQKSNKELKMVLATELSLCVSYWEDGSDVDGAIKGLELLADEWL